MGESAKPERVTKPVVQNRLISRRLAELHQLLGRVYLITYQNIPESHVLEVSRSKQRKLRTCY